MSETDTGSVQPPEPERSQVVDPRVSREKFDIELAEFRRLEDVHRRRGWWLLEADFPSVVVAFVAAQLRPAPVVCAAHIDFTNYDLEPPSVRLVDPFTREPYRANQLPTSLLRRQVIQVPGMVGGPQMMSAIPLMQAHQPTDIPFLCVPGVREYHAHPAHTGDSWLTHRGQGAGKLFPILNTIYQYGIQPITDYGIGMRVIGFQQGDPPA
jgi:hypothetical protein